MYGYGYGYGYGDGSRGRNRKRIGLNCMMKAGGFSILRTAGAGESASADILLCEREQTIRL